MKRSLFVMLFCMIVIGCNSESNPTIKHTEETPAQEGQQSSSPDQTSNQNSLQNSPNTPSNAGPGASAQPGHPASIPTSIPGGSSTPSKPAPSKNGASKPKSANQIVSRNRIASSNAHHVFIKNGNIYSWGQEGAWLGHGEKSGPAKVISPATPSATFRLVAATENRTAVVTEDGQLQMWFPSAQCQTTICNYEISILRNSKLSSNTLSNFWNGKPVVHSVAVGSEHTAVIADDGVLYTWGNGKDGKLGQYDSSSRTDGAFYYGEEADYDVTDMRPVPFFSNNGVRITSVALSDTHSAAVSDDGRLFTWGNGAFGKLGHGNYEKQTAPKEVIVLNNENIKIGFKSVALGPFASAAIDTNDDLYLWGESFEIAEYGNRDSHKVPKHVSVPGPVASVAVGAFHVAAIANGDVYTWGFDSHGRLGRGGSERGPGKVDLPAGLKAEAVSIGGDDTVVVTTTGRVFTWGNNKHMTEVIINEETPAASPIAKAVPPAPKAPVIAPAPAVPAPAAPASVAPAPSQAAQQTAPDLVPPARSSMTPEHLMQLKHEREQKSEPGSISKWWNSPWFWNRWFGKAAENLESSKPAASAQPTAEAERAEAIAKFQRGESVTIPPSSNLRPDEMPTSASYDQRQGESNTYRWYDPRGWFSEDFKVWVEKSRTQVIINAPKAPKANP